MYIRQGGRLQEHQVPVLRTDSIAKYLLIHKSIPMTSTLTTSLVTSDGLQEQMGLQHPRYPDRTRTPTPQLTQNRA